MKLIGGSAHSFKICYLTPGPKSYDQLEFKYPSERENQWREKKKKTCFTTTKPKCEIKLSKASHQAWYPTGSGLETNTAERLVDKKS